MERYKKWLMLAGAILLVLCLFFWQTKGTKKEENVILTPQQEPEEATEDQQEFVMVDIKGAVQREGVYELSTGTRVKEALEKAGGVLMDADTSSINLAQLVHDQMMITVPKKGEQLTGPSSQAGKTKVAINVASKEELEQIPGIGPKKAESILKYREQHGSFRKIEDLLEVEGIGEKSLERLKDEIVVP